MAITAQLVKELREHFHSGMILKKKDIKQNKLSFAKLS